MKGVLHVSRSNSRTVRLCGHRERPVGIGVLGGSQVATLLQFASELLPAVKLLPGSLPDDLVLSASRAVQYLRDQHLWHQQLLPLEPLWPQSWMQHRLQHLRHLLGMPHVRLYDRLQHLWRGLAVLRDGSDHLGGPAGKCADRDAKGRAHEVSSDENNNVRGLALAGPLFLRLCGFAPGHAVGGVGPGVFHQAIPRLGPGGHLAAGFVESVQHFIGAGVATFGPAVENLPNGGR